MDISLITSQSLLRLLDLAERKEQILQLVEEINDEIVRTLHGGVVVEVIAPAAKPALAAPAAAPKAAPAAPQAKRKSNMSPEGRARIAAAAKARWAKVRAAKSGMPAKAPKAAKAAKLSKAPKAAKAPKVAAVKAPEVAVKPEKKKRNVSPEVRAKFAASMRARWAARKAAKAAGASGKPAKSAGKIRLQKPE